MSLDIFVKSGICQFNKLINYLRGCRVVIRIGLIEVHALLLGFADNRFEKYACGPNAQQNMTRHDPPSLSTYYILSDSWEIILCRNG